MIKRIHREKLRLPLPSGGCIVLADMLGVPGSSDEVNRNVYCLDPDGSVFWQISAAAFQGERQPYTSIYFDDQGRLKAYCWHGAEYLVDIGTGEIDAGVLLK